LTYDYRKLLSHRKIIVRFSCNQAPDTEVNISVNINVRRTCDMTSSWNLVVAKQQANIVDVVSEATVYRWLRWRHPTSHPVTSFRLHRSPASAHHLHIIFVFIMLGYWRKLKPARHTSRHCRPTFWRPTLSKTRRPDSWQQRIFIFTSL